MTIPGHHQIRAQCRCGAEMTLEAPLDADPDLIDRLARITTCGRCQERSRPEKKPKQSEYRPPYAD